MRNDSVSGIENITGTNNKDTITADSSNNSLNGAGGTDTIYGLAGDDIIRGGANSAGDASNVYEILDGGTGVDTIYGGAGNDSILGGAGDYIDSLYGEAGNDIIRSGSGNDIVDAGDNDDTVYGDSGEDELVGGLGDDTIRGGTEADIIYGDDTLRTNASGGADVLYGEDGVDTIYAGYGDDTLSGGANNDTMYGDNGSDTVTYAESTSGVTVNLATGVATGEGTDTLYSIENAIGSKYDDTFISDFTVSNRFDGGSDESGEIYGDSISYQAVNVGSDTTLDKVVINLSTGADAQGYYDAQIYQSGTLSITDKLKNMENITGSAGNDTITGDIDDNTLYGLAGDDTLKGESGNDYINGGLGADTLFGGAGNDHLEGLDGNDTASFEDKTVAVTVDFKNNVASTTTDNDTLANIENAIGGTAKDKFLMNEDNVANIIDGGSDKDTISYEYYENNGVRVNLSTILAQVVVDNATGIDDTDTIKNIENIIGSKNSDIFICIRTCNKSVTSSSSTYCISIY